ncbi:MAG: cysteine desulfurase family protein [bacterium]|nr:cysteine desulfurase family protein [bacterium]
MTQSIYLDHAAATPVRPEVLEAMLPYFTEKFGNPSAMYAAGREARIAVDDARAQIAAILGCADSEIIFTGSGTESDNLALFGAMRALSSLRGARKGDVAIPASQGHLIVSAIEHHAVLEPACALEKEGFEVTYLPVDRDGFISLDELHEALRDDTTLVSIMYANNEIGTIQDIPAIAAVLKERKQKIYFHTDACQASGYLDLDVKKLGVDLMTLNASKIYGPKGIGVLYVRRGTPLQPLIVGGGQEGGMRSGTENVPAIVGMAKALELAQKEREQESARLTKLRDEFIEAILKAIPGATLNGLPTKRLPNNINITIPGVESEVLLMRLDEADISASTGSACAAGAIEPSHVLLALGLSKQETKSSVRFTLGRETMKADLSGMVETLSRIVPRFPRS